MAGSEKGTAFFLAILSLNCRLRTEHRIFYLQKYLPIIMHFVTRYGNISYGNTAWNLGGILL